MPHLIDPVLTRLYALDRDRLAATKVPIITVSGTYQEDLKRFYGIPNNNTTTDIVLSRAHFSMALGVATEIWGKEMDPAKAWIADPTNYVSAENWRNVRFTEAVGKILARNPLLNYLKQLLDRFGRSKLPILSSITPPLLYLTEGVERPILCFHIAAGNVLVGAGKSVIQVVTDPHVRPEYVQHANAPHMRFCVFDDRTKLELLEVAAIHHIAVDPNRIIVTGPPVDPRIVAARAKKAAWRSGPMRLCLTTGGLGTNKAELQRLLSHLLPHLRHRNPCFHLLMYTGTQADIAQMAREVAREERVAIGDLDDKTASLRLIYHPQILDANELLIRHGFPWAHGFLTKPSGDMAYDAVAAGCFLLTLEEWGVWEERIGEIFEQKDIARRAEVDHIVEQLELLSDTTHGESWVERAMNHAFGIEKLFLMGAKQIAKVAQG